MPELHSLLLMMNKNHNVMVIIVIPLLEFQATENNNTIKNSRQLHEQVNKEKKVRTHEFTEARQLPTSSE